jgi:hypothetical protein
MPELNTVGELEARGRMEARIAKALEPMGENHRLKFRWIMHIMDTVMEVCPDWRLWDRLEFRLEQTSSGPTLTFQMRPELFGNEP